MALVRETGSGRGLGKGRPARDQAARAVQLPHGAEAARAGAEGRPEPARERPAVKAGQTLQRSG